MTKQMDLQRLLNDIQKAGPFQAARLARELESSTFAAKQAMEASLPTSDSFRAALEASASFTHMVERELHALQRQPEALLRALQLHTDQLERLHSETYQSSAEILRRATEASNAFAAMVERQAELLDAAPREEVTDLRQQLERFQKTVNDLVADQQNLRKRLGER